MWLIAWLDWSGGGGGGGGGGTLLHKVLITEKEKKQDRMEHKMYVFMISLHQKNRARGCVWEVG